MNPHLAYLGDLSQAPYLKLIQDGLRFIHFDELAKPDTRVFIKPNLTFPTYQPGVMTNPEAVEAAILAIRDYTPHIFIGDSDSGGYNRFSMDAVYQETGIAGFADRYGVNIINLSHIPRKTIEFSYQNHDIRLELPRLLTDEVDFLITMPVPKIHNNTGVSLSFKNQWGCIPEPNDRLQMHPYFQHVVLEVNRSVRTQVAIMDGKYGLNRNGPLRGHPVELNWVLVANDPGTAARLGLELMQVPLDRIAHLRYAQELGMIPDRDQIKSNTSLQPFLKERFYLKREWTDYPGLFAFNSPQLAYLAYFSPLAGLLHKLLYFFRKPFYDYQKYSNR